MNNLHFSTRAVAGLITTLTLALQPLPAAAQLNVNLVRAHVTPPGQPTLFDLNTQQLAQISSNAGGAPASASTSRTLIETATVGNGALQTGPRSAAGDSLTPYTLWHVGENRALSAAEASGLALNFNFVASGYTVFNSLQPDGGRGVDFHAVVTSDFGRSVADSFAQTCGVNCSTSGNAGLGGAIGAPVVTPFAVAHQDWPTGSLVMGLGTFSTGAAESMYSLSLNSVTWLNGPVPQGGLALHFLTGDDVLNTPTVTVFAVTPVPEPATAPLALLGLGLLGGWVARRRSRDAGRAKPVTSRL